MNTGKIVVRGPIEMVHLLEANAEAHHQRLAVRARELLLADLPKAAEPEKVPA